MKALLQVGLVLLLAFLGFVGGGMIGAQWVPEGNGLAGGATVFLWALGGMAFSIIAAAVAVSRLTVRMQRRLLLVCAALTALVLAAIAARMSAQTQSSSEPRFNGRFVAYNPLT